MVKDIIGTLCTSPKGSLTALLHNIGEERYHSSTLMAFNTEGRKDCPQRYFIINLRVGTSGALQVEARDPIQHLTVPWKASLPWPQQ